MNRQRYLDAAKGIGILLVVLGHASLKNEFVLTYIYSFHMPLFFVIAGMLLKLTGAYEREYSSLVRGRLFSIMLPYGIFSIIYTALDFILKDEYKITNLKATLTLQGSGPLWFLPTLFIAELMFIGIIKSTNEKHGLFINILLGTLSLAIPKFILTSAKTDILHPANEIMMNISLVLFRSTTCLLFLAVGYISIHFIEGLKSKHFAPLCGVLMLGINVPFVIFCRHISGSSASAADMHNMNLGPSNCMYMLCALLGSIGIILLCKGCEELAKKPVLRIADKLIRFWGMNSLLIMVTHLNCKVLYAGNLFAMFMNPHITRAKEYVFLFNVLWVTIVIETILILIVNKICPWIVGKKFDK